MKSIKTFTLISIVMLGMTTSVFASWWNPFMWFQKKTISVQQVQNSPVKVNENPTPQQTAASSDSQSVAQPEVAASTTDKTVKNNEKHTTKFQNSIVPKPGEVAEVTTINTLLRSSSSKKCIFDYKDTISKYGEHKKLTVYIAEGKGYMERDYFKEVSDLKPNRTIPEFILGGNVYLPASATSGYSYLREKLEKDQDIGIESLRKNGQYNTPGFALNEPLPFVCSSWIKDDSKFTLPKSVKFIPQK